MHDSRPVGLSFGTTSQPISLEQENATFATGGISDEGWEPTADPQDEFQWIQDPMLGNGLNQDIFGNLSWEALFQDEANRLNWNNG